VIISLAALSNGAVEVSMIRHGVRGEAFVALIGDANAHASRIFFMAKPAPPAGSMSTGAAIPAGTVIVRGRGNGR
jgi:hypothetical protein